MHRKRFFHTLIAILCVLTFALAGCSNPAQDIIGTWEYKVYLGSSLYGMNRYVFRENNTGSLSMISQTNSSVYSFEYEIEDNLIIFTLSNGNQMEYKFSFTDKDTVTIGEFTYHRK